MRVWQPLMPGHESCKRRPSPAGVALQAQELSLSDGRGMASAIGHSARGIFRSQALRTFLS